MAENVIQFVEEGDKYVAEIKVTSDFNLHIERDGQGFLFVDARTTEDGAYDSVRGAQFNYSDPVVDYDFTGVIYPKYIKIVSKVEPTKAVITSSGEVTQIGGGSVDADLILKFYRSEGDRGSDNYAAIAYLTKIDSDNWEEAKIDGDITYSSDAGPYFDVNDAQFLEIEAAESFEVKEGPIPYEDLTAQSEERNGKHYASILCMVSTEYTIYMLNAFGVKIKVHVTLPQ